MKKEIVSAAAAEEKPAIPVMGELEGLCAAVHPEVERAKARLEAGYYERLAEEALGPKWEKGVPGEKAQRLIDSVQGEVDCLHRAARSLVQSYQSVWSWRTRSAPGSGTCARAGTGSGTPPIPPPTPPSTWRRSGWATSPGGSTFIRSC